MEKSTTAQDKIVTKQETTQFRFPNADSAAENILHQAIQFCAKKMGLEDAKAALQLLLQHNCSACQYCTYSIAQQVGETVGMLDQKVKKVYIIDYDATPEDVCFAQNAQPFPIHLIVWVDQKSSALDALLKSLNRALIQHYAELTGPCPLEYMLDTQMVDDADVDNRIGYGAMLTSIYQCPITVWER